MGLDRWWHLCFADHQRDWNFPGYIPLSLLSVPYLFRPNGVATSANVDAQVSTGVQAATQGLRSWWDDRGRGRSIGESQKIFINTFNAVSSERLKIGQIDQRNVGEIVGCVGMTDWLDLALLEAIIAQRPPRHFLQKFRWYTRVQPRSYQYANQSDA